ncbi:MAG: hypothetical protein ABI615_07495 [Chthoniobacterales bacterium]
MNKEKAILIQWIRFLLLIASFTFGCKEGIFAEEAKGRGGKTREVPSDSTITLQCVAVTLKNDDALKFSTQYNLSKDAVQAYADLQKSIDSKQAIVSRVVSVSSKGGQKSTINSGYTSLETEALAGRNLEDIDADITYTNSGARIVTSVAVKNGGMNFLGCMLNPTDATTTDFIFVWASCAHGTQAVPPNPNDGRYSWNLTQQLFLITLSSNEAAAFSAKYNTEKNAMEALSSLEHLVSQKKATSTGVFGVTVKSGLLSVSRTGKDTLTVMSTLDRDGKNVNLKTIFEYTGGNITKELLVHNGEVSFLGTISDLKVPTSTTFAFIKSSYPEVGPVTYGK